MNEASQAPEGILVLDKPAGITSHDVVKKVRQIMKVRRIGHTGTLDPFATGVLVLCVGRATRVARYFEGLDKAYRAVVKLGLVTETGDGEGTPVESHQVPELSADAVETLLETFRGTITQRPPAYSALKVDGVRLYARARRGEDVSAPLREVTIRTLRLERLKDDEMSLYVECSKGTYIRSLATDIGEAIGCGAHCAALRRTKVGPFGIEEALSLEDLGGIGDKRAGERLIGLDAALGRFLEPIGVTPEGASHLVHGRSVGPEAIAKPPAEITPQTTYRAVDTGGLLIALVEADSSPEGIRWVPSRVLGGRN